MGATAQEVLAPPPLDFSQKALTSPALGTPTLTNQLEAIPSETAPAVPSASQRWLDWGPIHLHPHPLYRISYGNGIQAQPGQQSKTTINQLSPGLLVALANHWNLDFTPTLSFYSSRAFRNTTDYSVLLSGATTYQDWSFGLSQSYVSSSQPLVETASQTDTETYSTGLNAIWHMSTKTSLELGASQNFQFVGQSAPGQQLSDSRTWSTLNWLNYQFWPKFGAAIGLGFSYIDMSVGSDMTSEQIQGRVTWRVGEKLSLSANAGFQDTQFVSSSEPAYLSPVFGLVLQYKLFEPTTLSLTANETVSPSYFQNQFIDTTSIATNIRQRLLKRLFLDFGASYTTSSYQATQSGVSANNKNYYTSLIARLTCPFLQHGSASVFYNWSENSSNQPGFGYTSTQIGFELGYHF